MRAGSNEESGLVSLMRDPLIRLVMQSDGVTDQAMMALINQVQDAWTERTGIATARRVRAATAEVIPFPTARQDPIRCGEVRSDG